MELLTLTSMFGLNFVKGMHQFLFFVHYVMMIQTPFERVMYCSLLFDTAVHRQVTTLLASFLVATHRQENLFFDGSKVELSAYRAVIRLRFSDAKVFSTL
ncbi:hypothetical protein ACFX15_033547 [Malus domestica]